jgi:glycerol-3-phosphate acyltransferase PlsY
MTPDIEAAHGWANLAPWLGVTTALILITVLWRRRYVSTPVAIGAGAASLLVPPWILPGAGVIVSVFARVLPRRRRSLADPRR